MDRKMTMNKYCFGLGTLGRDALYTLISMFIMNYLTGTVGLSGWSLGVVGALMVVFRIFDALNDPIMGTIVDNTNTKWGKFKPWILFGMLTSGLFTVLLFHNFNMSEAWYIAVFAICYLLWGMAYTTNDIAYWSLMLAISKDQKLREGIGAIARICANVGMFAVVLLFPSVPAIFSGFGLTPRESYFIFAVLIVIVMWIFQMVTLLGVKEDRSELSKQERTGLRGMVRALVKNDQLMVTAIAMALFMIGYCTTTSFGLYYFKYAYGDEGTYTVFAAVLAVAQLTALSVFPLFSKRFNRKQLYFGAMVAVVLAYLIFFFSFEQLPLIVIAGLILFFAQAIIQLLMLLFLADAVEYGEWKLRKRNESVSFAVQPFINKLGGALGSAVVTVTLIISSLDSFENKIASATANITDAEAIAAVTKEIASGAPSWSVWVMKIAMMILPLICILLGFIIYQKKFKIDEKMYAKIVADLEERNGSNAEQSNSI